MGKCWWAGGHARGQVSCERVLFVDEVVWPSSLVGEHVLALVCWSDTFWTRMLWTHDLWTHI